MAAPVTANVCTECDGSGRAALETNSNGSQMGDCPRCTRACAACGTRILIADATDGCCAECIRELKQPQRLPVAPYRAHRAATLGDYDTLAEREMDR